MARTCFECLVALALASLLGGCSMAGSRTPPEQQACGSWDVCTPEDALTASIIALRTNGDSLHLDCGVDAERSEKLTRACLERVHAVVARLSTEGAHLKPIAPDSVHVTVDETCLDTFIPGNEASDCAFYSYHADVPLVWRQ
jgi:hypothetical protein